MNYELFLAEIRRSKGVAPEEEDPKAKTTPMRQKLRDAGDVGLKDTVARIKGKPVESGQEYRKAGKEIATAATGVEFGDKASAIDSAIDKIRGAARYQALEREKADAAGDKARAKELDQGIDPREYDKQSTKKRMAVGGSAAGEAGRLTGTKEVDDALRDARVAAEKPRLRDPIKVGGTDIYDRPYLRHGYQASGADDIQLPKELPDIDDDEAMMDYIEKQDEFLDSIGVANIDPDKPLDDKSRAGQLDVNRALDRSGIETDRIRTPSVRDLENITPEAEKMGVEAGKEYLTPKVLKHQSELRKALSTMDNEAVQKLAFKHEISDELLDRFIDRYGQSRSTKAGEGKKKLLARAEGMGATAKDYAKYGGEDLFGGEVPEWALPKMEVKENGKKKMVVDPDAPPGVYDLAAVKKKDKELYKKAIETRAREVLRTYLKQGGVDAYAAHEGLRSITDMDLEHIRSLKADAIGDEESGGGYDHPSNYVMASGQLNKLRAADPMDKRAAKYIEGLPTAAGIDKEAQKTTFGDFLGKMTPEDRSSLQSKLKTIKIGKTGGISQSNAAYEKRTQDQVEADREVLKKDYKVSDAQAKAMVPDMIYDKSAEVMGKNIAGEEGRMVGAPYPTDPEQYAQDIRTNERDYLMFNAGLAELKKLYPGTNEAGLLASPEGQQMIADLTDNVGAAKMRKMKKAKPKDEGPVDILDIGI